MCFRKGGAASKLQILCQFFPQTYDSPRIKGIIIFRATLVTCPTDSDIITKQIHSSLGSM